MTTMISLKQRMCFFLIAGALVVLPLGRGLSLRKAENVYHIPTVDIGSVVRDVRIESCGRIDKQYCVQCTMYNE